MGPSRAEAARRGFTLIELMIVVAIIGILAAIAVPKFADLIRKSNDGATKGNLSALRSAVSIYYAEMEGVYPGDIASLTPKYISEIPKARLGPYHSESSDICVIDWTFAYFACYEGTGGSGGEWIWFNWTNYQTWHGTVRLNCLHTDSKNGTWWAY